MKDSEKLAGSKACVDGLVTSWRKTNLTDIEEWSLEEAMIWGVFKLALYLLPTSDYQKLKNYVLEEYGHDVGGAVGTFKYGVIENNAPGSFHEREKGEWILVVDSYYEDGTIKENHWECSKCGSGKSGWGEYKFCPNCGADMRGGKE